MPFLGHVVGWKDVYTDPLKVTIVADWPVPTDLTGVRSFFGLCSYYRRSVPIFFTIAILSTNSPGKRRTSYKMKSARRLLRQ